MYTTVPPSILMHTAIYDLHFRFLPDTMNGEPTKRALEKKEYSWLDNKILEEEDGKVVKFFMAEGAPAKLSQKWLQITAEFNAVFVTN